MATLKKRLERLTELRALPAVLTKLLSILGDENATADDIARVIVHDQALCVAILRAANSAAFGVRETTTSLDAAVMRLGFAELRKLVMAHQAALLFDQPTDGYGLDANDAWEGAVAGAFAADRIGRAAGHEDPATCFTAALLRDCGKGAAEALVGSERIASALLGTGADETSGARSSAGSAEDNERRALGFCHAEVGAALAEIWDLPSPLVEAIRFHHTPPPDNETALIDIVHCADSVATQLGYGVGLDGLEYPFDSAAHERAGLAPEAVHAILVDVWSDLAECKANLLGNHRAA